MSLNPHFTFYCKISKITLDESELRKVSPIKMGTSSQSHDSIHLKILPKFLEVFLRHLSFSYCRRKTFNEAYDKINEFSDFKDYLVSRFNKLEDTATELGSKDSFLRTWNSLLNYNRSLNMPFN